MMAGFAQNARLSGVVKDAKNGETVIGCSVIISESLQGAATDLDGNYLIGDIAPGSYTIIFNLIGYNTDTLHAIKFGVGEYKTINHFLREDSQNLERVEIIGNRITHTENAVMIEMRKSEQVVSGISSQQIAKSQDRNASDVVKRIPGITIADNRFMMMRGLSERYNSVWLNNVNAPSFEADRKAFSFDVLPSQVIDRIFIYKSASPELPGDFSGGLAKVFLKNITEEPFYNIGFSMSVRPGTSFNKAIRGVSHPLDYLALGAGNRKLSQAFPEDLDAAGSADELTALGRSFSDSWAPQSYTGLPDMRLVFNMGHLINKGKIKAAEITSFSYGLGQENFMVQNNNYDTYNLELGKSDTIYTYKDEQYNQSTRWNLMHNWSLQLPNGSKLEFKNFINQMSSNKGVERKGQNFDAGYDVQNYAYRYYQRFIYSGQVAGKQELRENVLDMEWTAGFGCTNSLEPDYRRVRTVRDINSQPATPYQVIIPASASPQDAGRFFGQMYENMLSANADIVWQPLKKYRMDEKLMVKIGSFNEWKNRRYEARWMSYKKARIESFDNSLLFEPLSTIFADENINPVSGFILEEGTNKMDEYLAFNLNTSLYQSVLFTPNKRISMSGGIREECNRQELSSADFSGKAISVSNPVLSLLPSINLNYQINNSSLVRLAGFKSINRPEFRELAPFAYYDFERNNVITGNPDLGNASIANVDLRYEYYPGPGEIFSAGVFYKHFQNPIELYYVPGAGGSGGTRNFKPGNAHSAQTVGAEFEMKIALAGTHSSSVFRSFSASFNASWIFSKVNLGAEAIGQDKSRPLMGQSPYIINAGVYYAKPEKGLSASVLYNIIGRRIIAAGTYGTPDLYEMPRHGIDLNLHKSFGKHIEIKWGIQDLLNEPFLLQQDSNLDKVINNKDETIWNYRRGAYYTFGVNYKFL